MAKDTFRIGTVKGPEGTPVKVEQDFEFDYTVYENMESAKSAWSEADTLALINSQEKANARAGKYQAALKSLGLLPDPNDPRVLRANLLRTYEKMGISREIAEAQVDSLLASKTE